MEFLIGLYLVGYFISVGIAFGFKEQNETWLGTFNFACFIGFLSWINVGLLIGDVCKKYLKEYKPTNNE
jgi:hypothetical protein